MKDSMQSANRVLASLPAKDYKRLAKQLELLTGLESRITILGHLQRGGIPSAADRLLATDLRGSRAEVH